MGAFGFDVQIVDPITSAINSWSSAAIGDRFASKSEKRSMKRQYAYAQLYAKNSPSWSVEGLRKANLNPILAATDGAFSSPTLASVGSTTSFASGSGSKIGVSELVGKQVEDLDADIKLKESDIKLKESESELKEAQKANVEVDTRNKLETNGLTGPYGAASVVLNKATPSSAPSDSHDTKIRHHPSDSIVDHPKVPQFIKEEERRADKIESSIKTPSWYESLRERNASIRASREKEYRLKHPPKRNRNSNFWYHQ